MSIINEFVKTDLTGSVKLGEGSILYVDDISEKAREYLNKNKTKYDTNKEGQLLITLPKDTVFVPAMRQSNPQNSENGISMALYILPDNSLVETFCINFNGVKVLLGAP